MIKLIGVWMFEWLWCLSNLIIKPRMLSYKKGFQREVNCGKFNVQEYDNGIKKIFNIKSDFGYVLSCELLFSKEEASNTAESKLPHKIAILCHGLGYAKYGSLKYAQFFLKLGFTVLIYDHRNHGLSGKAHTSMGYYEKYDLKKIIDWCYEQYGAACKIVTHGESMGAATVLLHLGIDNRVNCAIADCAYSDLKQLLRHQLKTYYHLPCFLIPLESCITFLRAGFWYKSVSPIKIISQTDIPILFIHGKIDNLVPAQMSKQMYESKNKNKAIYLVAGAKHAESYCVNKSGYEKIVERFLNTYL
ncbi:MAG: hypothetical protein K0S01_2790 [Herbinix sp.]|nr:hypothetical protein [Herbinix sp.]